MVIYRVNGKNYKISRQYLREYGITIRLTPVTEEDVDEVENVKNFALPRPKRWKPAWFK